MMRPQLAAFIAGSASARGVEGAAEVDRHDGVPALDREILHLATCWMPALLTRMSTRPNSAAAACIMASISAGLYRASAPW